RLATRGTVRRTQANFSLCSVVNETGVDRERTHRARRSGDELASPKCDTCEDALCSVARARTKTAARNFDSPHEVRTPRAECVPITRATARRRARARAPGRCADGCAIKRAP